MRIVFLLIVCFFSLSVRYTHAQLYNINSFFTQYPAISWANIDSNNYIYSHINDKRDIINVINKECPFSIEQTEHPENILPVNTYDTLHGLHMAEPFWDTILQEIRVPFILDSILHHWYGYKNTSTIDTTTAFLIIPGTGIHSGWAIASANPNNYHNFPSSIRDALLPHGDVFTISKFNEDFRSIWRMNNGAPYKLNYNVLGPLSNNRGQNWAANLVIESIAAVKWLKQRYNKVIVLGLSNGGIISLISALEGNADGAVIATGLSVHTYNGFPVTNFENPLYYRLHAKYALDSIKQRLGVTNNYYLFGFGANDFYASYEYQTHALEDTLLSTGNSCHLDFTYNYSGHNFPISYLDTFITKVKADTCAPLLSKFRNNVKVCSSEKPKVKAKLIKGTIQLEIAGEAPLKKIIIFERGSNQLVLCENVSSSKLKRRLKLKKVFSEIVVLIQTDSETYTHLVKL